MQNQSAGEPRSFLSPDFNFESCVFPPNPKVSATVRPRVGCTHYPAPMDAELKVFTTYCEPYFSISSQMKPRQHSTASGLIISGLRGLSNANAIYRVTLVKKSDLRGSTPRLLVMCRRGV